MKLHPKSAANASIRRQGLSGKAQEENTCPQMLQGSNIPGRVEGGQENGRREEDKKMRRGKRELEKRAVKEKPTGLCNILFKWTLNKNIEYKSTKHLEFE